ncbi:hypothetical protein RBSWK_01507 [Rhodopirellula baltica SWK14]|uniref:Uncharacterized protein n=1 Tax=Rhodopirellula baltica SWK14 TaxID=993516 RepID=L7CKV5_RHOBT|nr:hypothetical protein RBSWK_01507 [Rhodopirellula baltica SWK14]
MDRQSLVFEFGWCFLQSSLKLRTLELPRCPNLPVFASNFLDNPEIHLSV